MADGPDKGSAGEKRSSATEVTRGSSNAWTVAAILTLILVIAAFTARLAGGPSTDGFVMLAAGVASAVLVLRLLVRAPAPPAASATEPLKDLLDSAGPAIVAMDSDAHLTYINPAGERMLGYDAAELTETYDHISILAPGEGKRLVVELEKLGAGKPAPGWDATPASRRAAYLKCVRDLPPSVVPAFEMQMQRKDGALVPVTLHMSGLRDAAGRFEGAVLVAMDQSGTLRQEQEDQESQERYRDLFEHSSNMIATLSPAGRFLYANPAWKQYFGLDNDGLMKLNSFEELFEAESRGEAAAYFRRALDGEAVDARAAASPFAGRPGAGSGAEPEPAAEGGQSAGGALPVARRHPAKAARAPAGAAAGSEPDRGRKRVAGSGGHAHSGSAVPLPGMGRGDPCGWSTPSWTGWSSGPRGACRGGALKP